MGYFCHLCLRFFTSKLSVIKKYIYLTISLGRLNERRHSNCLEQLSIHDKHSNVKGFAISITVEPIIMHQYLIRDSDEKLYAGSVRLFIFYGAKH